jgi:hypothetical protein
VTMTTSMSLAEANLALSPGVLIFPFAFGV